jgi:hypothetical protein
LHKYSEIVLPFLHLVMDFSHECILYSGFLEHRNIVKFAT